MKVKEVVLLIRQKLAIKILFFTLSTDEYYDCIWNYIVFPCIGQKTLLEDSSLLQSGFRYLRNWNILLTSSVADPLITRNRIQKFFFFLYIQSFYCLKWNMLFTGVVYLIFDRYYFIISINQWTYKFMREWTCT